LVYHIAAGKVIERGRCYPVLNKYSVFMMLLIITASLVGISSVYQPAGVATQLLQPALASPPGVANTQLPQPPGLPMPPLIPIPPPTTSPQQESSGGPRVS
jgi:hypothetical protein